MVAERAESGTQDSKENNRRLHHSQETEYVVYNLKATKVVFHVTDTGHLCHVNFMCNKDWFCYRTDMSCPIGMFLQDQLASFIAKSTQEKMDLNLEPLVVMVEFYNNCCLRNLCSCMVLWSFVSRLCILIIHFNLDLYITIIYFF